MAELTDGLAARASLAEAVDHLLDRGAVLTGEAMLSLAGVDLVYLGLNLVVGSVETLRRQRCDGVTPDDPDGRALGTTPPRRTATGAGAIGVIAVSPVTLSGSEGYEAATRSLAPAAPITHDTETRPEAGLARLVLTLVEFLRELLERQAVRRIEGTGLSDDELERMGRALIELEQKMAELREIFGLGEADLRLDLGPLL